MAKFFIMETQLRPTWGLKNSSDTQGEGGVPEAA